MPNRVWIRRRSMRVKVDPLAETNTNRTRAFGSKMSNERGALLQCLCRRPPLTRRAPLSVHAVARQKVIWRWRTSSLPTAHEPDHAVRPSARAALYAGPQGAGASKRRCGRRSSWFPPHSKQRATRVASKCLASVPCTRSLSHLWLKEARAGNSLEKLRFALVYCPALPCFDLPLLWLSVEARHRTARRVGSR